MAKSGGLGDYFSFNEFDVSGDIGALGRVGGGLASTQNVTPINASAMARLGLLRDGGVDWSAFWNPGAEANAAHNVLSALPLTDVHLTYFRGGTLGSPAASMIGKQVTYDGNRSEDGAFTFECSGLPNGYGLEWGNNLTTNALTQGAAGNGTSVDLGASVASYSLGWSMYLAVYAFTGTSITVKIQDSANDSAWLDLSGATFAAASDVGVQRVQSATATDTVRRYLRIVSTGTFSNAVFSVNFVRHEAEGFPS